ncbi:MAG: radical SAM protein [Prolixibacteraceae bacterium]|nr:radical SAM protein [Prolixibacteraceae bacterium]
MRILMLNPPFLPKYSRSSRSPAVTKSGTIYYPLWLSYATGVLEKEGFEVLLIDAAAENADLDDILPRICSFKPEIAVFDTSTPSIDNDIQVLEQVKNTIGGRLLTVVVGTHPSALPEETLMLSDKIDIIARKEYDYTLRELSCKISTGDQDLSSIQGISYRKSGKIFHNADRPFITEMDDLPFVSAVYKKHLDIRNYFYAHVRNPVVSFFAGRGCPNRCFFCVYPQVMFGHAYRHRSPENIVAELEYVKRELSEVVEVLIDDDNFTADQEHVLKVCDLIIKKKLKVAWTVEARVDLKLEVMMAMKKAGCRLLVAGFESGDQQILDNVQKGIKLEQSMEFVKNAQKAGLRVHGCFMVGNKGETHESMERTLDFALKLNADTAQFFPLMVYPGTRAYAWASEHSYIKAGSFRDWLTEEGLHNCVLNTEHLSADELVRFCDYARKKYYLRLGYIIRKGFDILVHPSEIRRTFKAFKTLSRHLLRSVN